MQSGNKRGPERLEGGYEVMKKTDYLLMLFQDNETESEPKKELHAAVLECTVEALSQTSDDFEIDGKIGLEELFEEIQKNGADNKIDTPKIFEQIQKQQIKVLSQCVSPFLASELIAKKLGVEYVRPIDRLKATFCSEKEPQSVNLEDFL